MAGKRSLVNLCPRLFDRMDTEQGRALRGAWAGLYKAYGDALRDPLARQAATRYALAVANHLSIERELDRARHPERGRPRPSLVATLARRARLSASAADEALDRFVALDRQFKWSETAQRRREESEERARLEAFRERRRQRLAAKAADDQGTPPVTNDGSSEPPMAQDDASQPLTPADAEGRS